MTSFLRAPVHPISGGKWTGRGRGGTMRSRTSPRRRRATGVPLLPRAVGRRGLTLGLVGAPASHASSGPCSSLTRSLTSCRSPTEPPRTNCDCETIRAALPARPPRMQTHRKIGREPTSSRAISSAAVTTVSFSPMHSARPVMISRAVLLIINLAFLSSDTRRVGVRWQRRRFRSRRRGLRIRPHRRRVWTRRDRVRRLIDA